MPEENRCNGCYRSDFDGSWWCDNCDQWPCRCNFTDDSAQPTREA